LKKRDNNNNKYTVYHSIEIKETIKWAKNINGTIQNKVYSNELIVQNATKTF